MDRIVRISHVTQGFLHELSPGEQEQAVAEFHAQARGREDWFYGVLKDSEGRPRVFVEQNETGAYTAPNVRLGYGSAGAYFLLSGF